MSTIVLGAGIAGLTAANTLVEAGDPVLVVDKGRSVGGRLATRRIGGATLDHGAQFFTVRTPEFREMVDAATRAGIVTEWCRGFGPREDGHPRYAVVGGMNRLAKYLASGLDVRLDTAVTSIRRAAGRWELVHANGRFTADAVVLTAPVPQSLQILDASDITLDADIRARLDRLVYQPTLALLVTLDQPSAVPPPGGAQLTEGPFGFVADNQAKGISGRPAVTLHASHRLSADRWDDDSAAVTADLLEVAREWLGEAKVIEAQLKKWRYAQPVDPATDDYDATEVDGLPLVFAGDAFAASKVEGAYRSGRAAAHHLLADAGRLD